PMRESHSTAPHHAATALHTHSLHDALPIFSQLREVPQQARPEVMALLGMELDAVHVAVAHRRAEVSAVRGYRAYVFRLGALEEEDRKSTRLNSSHVSISYAVFCLKKNTNNV